MKSTLEEKKIKLARKARQAVGSRRDKYQRLLDRARRKDESM